jgi:hypothetical protein
MIIIRKVDFEIWRKFWAALFLSLLTRPIERGVSTENIYHMSRPWPRRIRHFRRVQTWHTVTVQSRTFGSPVSTRFRRCKRCKSRFLQNSPIISQIPSLQTLNKLWRTSVKSRLSPLLSHRSRQIPSFGKARTSAKSRFPQPRGQSRQ